MHASAKKFRSLLWAVVSFLAVAAVGSVRAEESNVIIVRDPVTGKVTMKSRPKEVDPTAAQAAPAASKPASRVEARPAATKPAPKTTEAQITEESPGAGHSLKDLPKLSIAIIVIGLLITLLSGIWTLVVWWREGIGWFFGGIFVPFVSLIFLCIHWSEAKNPFFLGLFGTAVIYGGFWSATLFAPVA